MQLREQGVDLEQEDNTAGLLGDTLGRDEANLFHCHETSCLVTTQGVAQ